MKREILDTRVNDISRYKNKIEVEPITIPVVVSLASCFLSFVAIVQGDNSPLKHKPSVLSVCPVLLLFAEE